MPLCAVLQNLISGPSPVWIETIIASKLNFYEQIQQQSSLTGWHEQNIRRNISHSQSHGSSFENKSQRLFNQLLRASQTYLPGTDARIKSIRVYLIKGHELQ